MVIVDDNITFLNIKKKTLKQSSFEKFFFFFCKNSLNLYVTLPDKIVFLINFMINFTVFYDNVLLLITRKISLAIIRDSYFLKIITKKKQCWRSFLSFRQFSFSFGSSFSKKSNDLDWWILFLIRASIHQYCHTN